MESARTALAKQGEQEGGLVRGLQERAERERLEKERVRAELTLASKRETFLLAQLQVLVETFLLAQLQILQQRGRPYGKFQMMQTLWAAVRGHVRVAKRQ